MKRTIFILLTFLLFSCNPNDRLFEFLPAPENSGFRMDGYFIWCGSVIKENDTSYHMFASRWTVNTTFPEGYRKNSEIVRAISKSPLGPFEFREVVIGERDSTYWDANMAHNPVIYKIKNKYVLFYIGSDFTSVQPNGLPLRRIGYAMADNLTGPWYRSDSAIFNFEANNPSLCIEPDNSVKIVFRNSELKVSIAVADSFNGKYKVVNDNVWPQCKLEDFYFYKMADGYHIICEDNIGGVTGHERWGIHLFSKNGIDHWEKGKPLIAYNHDIQFTNHTMHCVRRERPQFLMENGKLKYLYNGVYDGSKTWNQPVEIK